MWIGLQWRKSEVLQDFAEDLIPQAWGVLQPEAAAKHAQHFGQRIEVLIPRQPLEDADAAWRHRELDVTANLILELGRLFEGQASKDRL